MVDGSGVRGEEAPPDVRREDVAGIVQRCQRPLQALAGSTVLVTGAAGFLPSYLVDALVHANDAILREPCRVICVDNLRTGVAARTAHLQSRGDVRFIEHDLSQPLSLSDEKVDYVVHGASIASPTWYRRFPLETIDVNVSGTRGLLDLAHEHNSRSFVYLSSSEIYGDPPADKIPTSEAYWGHVSSTGPRACYDESKRLAETLCMTYHRLYGLPVRLVRPFNVYGPGLRLDDGRIVPDLIKAALDGEPLVLYSDGQATRSFCYIADFVAALPFLTVDDLPSGPYNVGNDEEMSIRACAELVDSLTPTPAGVRLEISDDAHYLTDNPQRRCPDLTKTQRAIPWRPVIGAREGLWRTLQSYREAVPR
jgi:UDP-glucuronate decarboxylase